MCSQGEDDTAAHGQQQGQAQDTAHVFHIAAAHKLGRKDGRAAAHAKEEQMQQEENLIRQPDRSTAVVPSWPTISTSVAFSALIANCCRAIGTTN
ncbi:hypothetical protein [Candidatus Amarolinea dominans]|uniref:hypothetical protein n=1 Tax=Candidatus Amarolinea dominans TaxID=3140696 RepID=UPI0031CCA960